jgi:hypothetical protein
VVAALVVGSASLLNLLATDRAPAKIAVLIAILALLASTLRPR